MMDELKWMLITANPSVARYAEVCGVHRIFVDMESLGKAERQKHLSAHMASHTLEDVAAVAGVLSDAELMVRLNPLHVGTAEEVDGAIEHGAGRLMLPMFRRPEEVERFLGLVGGRVPVTLLAETPEALTRLSTYMDGLGPRDEVHFGLNDLSLAMGLNYLFEPLAARLLESAATLLRERDIPFGFGGVARIGQGELPAEWVLSEHVRLGSSWVILSRAFHGGADCVETLVKKLDLRDELHRLRLTENTLRAGDAHLLESNRQRLEKQVFAIARGRRTQA
ncbi:MAG: aldolase/citrate lyase family protein [Pseudomonadota bacterium]|nr:aldolase/citrate lyase family protein [Pseudomonadota bacterium]